MNGFVVKSKCCLSGKCGVFWRVYRACSNTVNRFGRSSFYVGRYIASQGKTVEEKYFVSIIFSACFTRACIDAVLQVSEKDYATHGGAFPLKIKNVGVVGTITVSGLAQEVSDWIDK